MTSTNPNTLARDYAAQFLYQCEADKLYYFSEEHLENFISYFSVSSSLKSYIESLVKGVLSDFNRLDEIIAEHSKNWKISRMASMDRVVLRMSTYELLEKMAPDKVILNEAIELAKKYGTEHSSAFVNGILDAIVAQIRK